MIARALGLVLAAWLALPPATAWAHGGGHSGPASLGLLAAVTLQGYRLELLSHSGPLEQNGDNRVAVSITNARSGAAVSRASVLLGFGLPGGGRTTEPASEETWAGHYTISVHPERTGAHRVGVTLAAADGHAFDPPLTAEFAVDVGQAAGLGTWTVLLFALSLRAGRRLSLGLYPDAALAARAALPMALLALAFTVLGIVLLAQPMGLRHGM